MSGRFKYHVLFFKRQRLYSFVLGGRCRMSARVQSLEEDTKN